jgi:hypothetical protein
MLDVISTLCFCCAVCGGYPNLKIYNFAFYIFIALLATPITNATRFSTRVTDLYFSPFFSAWSAAHDGNLLCLAFQFSDKLGSEGTALCSYNG